MLTEGLITGSARSRGRAKSLAQDHGSIGPVVSWEPTVVIWLAVGCRTDALAFGEPQARPTIFCAREKPCQSGGVLREAERWSGAGQASRALVVRPRPMMAGYGRRRRLVEDDQGL